MINLHDEVTIVIISHKSRKKVINLISQISIDLKKIVVENSNDKLIEKDLSKLKNNIQLIFSKNNGYGSAINLARTKVTTKYFFVLNPDIQKINDKLINVFCQSAKELKDNFGALGPRFENVNEKSHKQSDINEKYGQIESISGSAMFFCTVIFDKNEGFDENFFLYFEETDYCNRSNKNNFKVYQINSQKVCHDTGTSVETFSKEESSKLKKLYRWHFIWSKFYFYKKKYGKLISLIIFIPQFLRLILRISLYTLNSNKEMREKYLIRYNGLMTSVKGKKSSIRINDFS